MQLPHDDDEREPLSDISSRSSLPSSPTSNMTAAFVNKLRIGTQRRGLQRKQQQAKDLEAKEVETHDGKVEDVKSEAKKEDAPTFNFVVTDHDLPSGGR